MKRKHSIGSFLFGLTIFLALLIQSVHSFHHIEEAFSKEHCHHDYSKSKHQITHSHEFDNCFTCEFAFSSSLKITSNENYFKLIEFSKKEIFNFYNKTPNHFSGSLFSLRGPPMFNT
jgi:hypothetical protein